MIEAMIAGERDPHVLAGMARGVMRRKIPQLEEALRGHFDDHHGFICASMLRRIDALAVDIAALDARIAEVLTPHLEVIDRLDEI
jgi:transposase